MDGNHHNNRLKRMIPVIILAINQPIAVRTCLGTYIKRGLRATTYYALQKTPTLAPSYILKCQKQSAVYTFKRRSTELVQTVTTTLFFCPSTCLRKDMTAK